MKVSQQPLSVFERKTRYWRPTRPGPGSGQFCLAICNSAATPHTAGRRARRWLGPHEKSNTRFEPGRRRGRSVCRIIRPARGNTLEQRPASEGALSRRKPLSKACNRNRPARPRPSPRGSGLRPQRRRSERLAQAHGPTDAVAAARSARLRRRPSLTRPATRKTSRLHRSAAQLSCDSRRKRRAESRQFH